MRTLVVSDLHFGQPGRLTAADRALFNVLVGDWDRVIFLGDMFDLWHFDYDEIVEQHKGILAAIDDLPCEVIFIPGNHDEAFRGMKRLNNMRVCWAPFEYEDGGKRITLAHGDEYDDLNETASKVSSWIVTFADRIACWIMGAGTSVQRKLRKSLANSPQRERYAGPIAARAVKDLGGDVVILGHTHLPETRQFEGTLYVNSGSFGPEDLTYVVIEDGVPELRRAE